MNAPPRATRASQRAGVAGGSPAAAAGTLSDEMLARFASRAATYDRENRFFDEDFMELRAAKYLLLPAPAEFGGAGMSLAQVCREQRRLAYHAPATALAVNMHLYRSEEHTSELQSPCNLVCRLLLEKKKKKNHNSPRLPLYFAGFNGM